VVECLSAIRASRNHPISQNLRRRPFSTDFIIYGKKLLLLMQNFEIIMKSVFSATILAILSLSFTAGIVQANKLSSQKGLWVDLRSTGIVFGTIAETVKKKGGPKGSVTYHIRRVNGRGVFEELDSKKGLFVLSLKPSLYEIYDWTVLGKPSRNIKIDTPVENDL